MQRAYLFGSRDAAPAAAILSGWHDVGGRTMHSRRATPAPNHDWPTVVLVHGQVVSSRYMTPLIERLGVHFPVWAPDLPGFGRSDKPRHVLTIRELADALADWMDATGLGEAVLLGNSMGCQIAVECALRHPRKVVGLVLQGPTPDPGRRAGSRMFANLVITTWKEESVGAGHLIDFLQAGPRRAFTTARYLINDPIERKLPHVNAPALVVRGAKDAVTSQAWAEHAARLLPRGELRVVPGAAHTMVTLAALELTRLARPFLLRLQRPEAHRKEAA
jgi:2-hydroxy-6-oxonona-2,4-dienedioate hydrolase